MFVDQNALDSQLRQELADIGIESDAQQRAQLLRHLELVLKKNQVLNLTRIIEPSEGVTLHIVDSLTLLPYLVESTDITHLPYLDLGTGAGYPGIPLHIMSGYDCTLIDSVHKKVTAVEEFCRVLGFDSGIKCESIRAEELATQHIKYGTVVARAVAQVAVLVEYASPLLCKHGTLVISKGPISDDENESGLRAAGMCGLELVSRETMELPRQLGQRTLLVFQKESNPKVKLPRRTGLAQHHPLG